MDWIWTLLLPLVLYETYRIGYLHGRAAGLQRAVDLYEEELSEDRP